MLRALPLLVTACLASAPRDRSPASEQHWLLLIAETADGWSIAQRVVVDAPLPRRRDAPPAGPVRVSLVDAEGTVLFSETRADPRLVRVERHVARHDAPAFAWRVPVLPEARAVTLEPARPGFDFRPGHAPLPADSVRR